MKYKRILEILDAWKADYPSLVITLLWRIELHLIHNEEIKASNDIMRHRADVYDILISKYEADDPDGIQIFKDECTYCRQTIRRVFTPEEVVAVEEKKKKDKEAREQYYATYKESSESMQVEEYGRESYTNINNYIIEQIPGVKSLFDVKFANKKYDDTEDRSILDILEILSYDEEKLALCAENTNFFKINRNHIGYHEDMLKFRGITGYDGKQHLCPFRTVYGMFYRGQKKYYAPCCSSIDRNLSDVEVFIERLKGTSIKYLFSNHPATASFNAGSEYQLPNGKKGLFVYNIDYWALAQHYGAYTNLLDLTSDKMIAAFFACTGYNWKKDIYYAYVKKGKGVYYVYRDKNIFSKDSRISCVGLQPLSRPGAQAGYVLDMDEKEDFNNVCTEAISFTHDKAIAKQIYELVNLLGEPFVADVMSSKAKDIVRGNTFSVDVLKETVHTFYPSLEEDIIKSWIKDSRLKVTNESSVLFTDQELEALNGEKSDVEEQLRTMVYNRVILSMKINN